MHATLPPSGFACHPPPGLGQKICRISVYKLPAKQKLIAPFLSKIKCCCPIFLQKRIAIHEKM